MRADPNSPYISVRTPSNSHRELKEWAGCDYTVKHWKGSEHHLIPTGNWKSGPGKVRKALHSTSEHHLIPTGNWKISLPPHSGQTRGVRTPSNSHRELKVHNKCCEFPHSTHVRTPSNSHRELKDRAPFSEQRLDTLSEHHLIPTGNWKWEQRGRRRPGHGVRTSSNSHRELKACD